MSSSADPSSSTNGADSKPTVTPQEIGWQFVPQYYNFVNKHPDRLHCFYAKNSTFVHGTEGDDVEPCTGLDAISKKITSIGFQDAKVFIHSVDSQPSANGAVLIQVIGEMSNKGEDWKKFAQTFFLAEQPNGYFVLNDIFRFLKDEDSAEVEAEVPSEAGDPVVDGEQEDEPSQVEEVKDEKKEEIPSLKDTDDAPQAESTPPPPSEPTPEPTPAPTAIPEPEAPTSSPTPTPSAPEPSPVEPPVDNTSSVPTPPAPAPIEPKKEEAKPEEKKDEPTLVTKPTPAAPSSLEDSKPSAPPAPKQTPPAPAIQRSQPPPPPAAPAAPMSWAARAAASKGAWGASHLAQNQATSSAPAPKPAASQNAGPPAGPSRENSAIRRSAAAEAAMTVQTSQCFVKLASWQSKGVSEADDQALLQSALERFGPVKAVEIVAAKACAFLDFASLDSARRAILASLPVNQGGEGGVRVGDGRVIVEVRKEKSERGPVGGGQRPPRGPAGQQQQNGPGGAGGGRGGPRGGAMGGRGGRGAARGGAAAGGPAKQ